MKVACAKPQANRLTLFDDDIVWIVAASDGDRYFLYASHIGYLHAFLAIEPKVPDYPGDESHADEIDQKL